MECAATARQHRSSVGSGTLSNGRSRTRDPVRAVRVLLSTWKNAMPYYIVESTDATLTIEADVLHGIPTTGHSRDLWLYVVHTEELPTTWPESPTGRGSGYRRAPIGIANWWVVVERGVKARSSAGLRSTRSPLRAPPAGYPVFDWP